VTGTDAKHRVTAVNLTGLQPGPAAGRATTPGQGHPGRRLRWQAYFRMGRTIRYENWLGTPLWWTALPAATATSGTTLGLIPLTLLIYMALVATGGTLDDVQGWRDGSDMINYQRSDPTGLRPLTRKPLLLGWVTEAQAIRYAAATAAVTSMALVAAWVIAGARPLWWLPGYGILLAAGSQYSYGLKLSYVGFQEPLFWAVKVGCVVFPYVLVTGSFSPKIIFLGVLFGLWFVQVLMCSNAHDVAGDRQAGRRTAAVTVSELGYRRLLTVVFGLSWLVAVTAVVGGWLSPWYALAIAPTAALHARQLDLITRRGSPLQARAIGFWALRVGVLGVCVVNLGVR
jgi:1,4-dihydroxy-2-naphthoate octaprenyltransferase